MSKPDLMFEYHGSIVLLHALTNEGVDWIDENLPEERIEWGGAIAIEPRYADNIAEGAMCDGLIVA